MDLKEGTCALPVLPDGTQIREKSSDPTILGI